MGDKTGLWGLLASACAVTGLVVLVGFVSAPSDGRAQLSATMQRPAPDGGGPDATIVSLQPTAAPVTIKARPKPTAAELARRAAKRAAKRAARLAAMAPPTLDFTISSFNVLGASHTRSGGAHARFGPGRERAHWATSLVRSHGVEVVGFQEMQAEQLGVFLHDTGGAYDVYPGYSLGSINTENSIAWRRDTFTAVEKQTFSIPYFRGHYRKMPMVKLRNEQTGLEAWFANVHNPASTSQWGNNQHWRDVATGIEIDLVNRLREQDHVPVFFTGDLNERAEFFCRWVGSTAQEAAMGGDADGGCHPPRIRYVDWITGSDATFSNYVEDAGALVRKTSDHPMVVSEAHIEGSAPAGASATGQ